MFDLVLECTVDEGVAKGQFLLPQFQCDTTKKIRQTPFPLPTKSSNEPSSLKQKKLKHN